MGDGEKISTLRKRHDRPQILQTLDIAKGHYYEITRSHNQQEWKEDESKQNLLSKKCRNIDHVMAMKHERETHD